ncbi:HYR domain-containing protein [Winogradskyella sp.]|uniref:HYR domain-containing protein n=1 Tax=Winogradskyella sp. TaxID=1883156 RepID=UPI003BAB06CA
MKTQLQKMRLLPLTAVNSPNINVLRALPIVLALGLCLSSLQPAYAQLTFIGGTGAIPDDGCPTNTSFTATSTAVGTFGTDINDIYLELDISHRWTADLQIRLLSPGGSTLDLAIGVGDAGDNFTNTVFRDSGATIASASAPFTGTFQPQGGTFASTFSGEASNGTWTLLICDDEGLYSGTLNSWSMTFDIGSDPVISCPNDITVNNASCNPTVSYSLPSASDTEDGTLTTTRTRGPATGSTFPAGDTVVEFSATDSDGNTSTCRFTVTVTDNTAPTTTVSCPSDITTGCNPVTYTPPTFSDNCGFPTVPTSVPGFSLLGTFGNSTYFISNEKTLPLPAFSDAGLNGYELVTINTQAENDYLQGQISSPIIIGLNDVATEGTFVWQSGQPVSYTNWDNSQPNDLGGQDHTIMNHHNGRWNDVTPNFQHIGPNTAYVVIEYHDYSEAPVLVEGLPTGSDFPLGTTTNTFYVEDRAGNSATCSFDVTVPGTFVGGTGNIPDNGCPTNTSFTATSTVAGTLGTDVTIASVTLDISHASTDNLEIRLLSPGGSTLNLALDLGSDGDNFTGTVFRDGGASIASASAPFTGAFQPQGGTFASAFSGQASNGTWTLLICDDEASDTGTLDSWSITFTKGSLPTFSGCPADITVNNGSCNPAVSYTAPTASDASGQSLTVTRTRGPATGSTFPPGDTIVEFSATDADCNTSTCRFTVTVVDNAAPTTAGCPSDIVSSCNPVVYTAPTFSDNCGFPPVPNTVPGFSLLGTFGNSTYFISDEKITAGKAIASAELYGHELVTINSQAENDYLNEQTGGASIVIGINDLSTEGTFEWQSGQPASYTNWGNGEPNNSGNEDYGEMRSDGQWNDRRADFTARAVIEYHDYSEGPVLAEGLPNGSVFPLGTTTNTFYAKDGAGNSATCSFDVTVPGTFVGGTGSIPDNGCPTNTPFTATSTVVGTLGTDVAIASVALDISHTSTDNLDIVLESPDGTTLNLALDVGGNGGNFAGTLFRDGGAAIASASAPFTGVFQPQGGTFASAFAGKASDGTWTLQICDDEASDVGTLDSWSITFAKGSLPTFSNCPADITVNNGSCNPAVSYTAPTASDASGQSLTVTRTRGPATGSTFPAGDTIVEFSATDADCNTSTCRFTVTVTDNTAPTTASCPSDITSSCNPVAYTAPTFSDNCGFPTVPNTVPGFSLLGTFGNSTYFISDDPVMASVAFTDAELNGYELVTINSRAENDYLQSQTGGIIIIGINDVATEGTFEWQSGQPVSYTNWRGSNPNNFGGNEHYGRMRSDGQWQDQSADFTAHAVIEYHDYSQGPILAEGLPSGSVFPLGTTANTFYAEDGAGNSATCSFDVTVPGTFVGGTGGIPDNGCPTNTPFTATSTVVGTLGTDVAIASVALDISHTSTDNLDIVLESPDGTTLNLALDLGSDGDDFTGTVFRDGGATIASASAPFTGTFQPQGGTFASAFAGKASNGDWTLQICDDEASDSGTLNSWSITFIKGSVPTFSNCPADITVNNGSCNPTVSYTAPTAQDASGQSLTVTRTRGPATGSTFPPGDTLIEFSATDAYCNTSTCRFTITVVDNTAPTAAGCPSDITSSCNSVAYTAPTFSDNCGFRSVPTAVPGFSLLGTFGNSTYFISDTTVEVLKAFADAELYGHELVTVNSQEENDYLKGQISSSIIIGINDVATENTFAWQSGQPASYTNWGGGEPNNSGGNEDYGEMRSDGLWNDRPGDFTAHAVIEYHDYSAGPVLAEGLPSGSDFPGGTTTNTFYAEDRAGNSATCSFDVIISNAFAGGTGGIPDGGCPTNTSFTATSTLVGTLGTDVAIASVALDISHRWNEDLQIRLKSPGGTTLNLAVGVGGDGDNFTGTMFQDGGDNIASASAPFTGVFRPQGGTFASAFAGEASNGTWTLLVCDNETPDPGTLNSWSITFDTASPPTFSNCPADITATGSCNPTVSYTPPTAQDASGQSLTVTRTLGPANGSTFPPGDTIVEFSATDASCNTSTCRFTVTVVDDTAPTISCPADITSTSSTGAAVPVAYAPTFSDNCGFRAVPTSVPGFSLLGTFGNSTYFISDDTVTARSAFTSAELDGYELATINSQAENDYLQGRISSPVFIGINDISTEGTYEWQSGQPVSYTNWNSGEPNNFGGGEDYGEMRSDGLWNDRRANFTAHVVIEYNDYTAVPTSVSGFSLLGTFGDSTYFISNQNTHIGNAYANAGTNGHKLVTINSQAENDAIQTWAANLSGADKLIIGLNDPNFTNVDYQWQSGQPVTYTNWGTGQPNDFGGNYAVMQTSSGKWDDVRGNFTGARVVIEFSSTGPVLVEGLPPGADFPLGTTTNTLYLEDRAGNSVTCSFTVNVDLATGNLMITEVMQNPDDVTDANGEYFEVYNNETEPVNLKGWTISDSGTDTHTIATDLIVAPGGFIVLGINDDPATNGGVEVHYQYSGIALDNTADEIILTDAASTEIDRVEYDGGTDWPDPDGAAMVYTGSNIQNNNSGSLWQAATAAEGISPDLGSPGSNGNDQILDWLVYENSAWNEAPSQGTGARNALVRKSEALTLGADISLNTLIVEPDADVDVSPSVTLGITDIVLESTSTDYASLILDGTLSGTTVTYRRHVNQVATSGGNDLISPPVTGQTFDGLLAANGNIPSNTAGTLYLFGPFDKTSGSYLTYSSTATDALTPGMGYRAATTDNGTLDFSGGINRSGVSVSISNSGPLEFSKWNLIGNPYPSYINVQAFLNNATNASVLGATNVAIYGYDGDASDGWTIYNLNTTTAGTVIAPGQGFFVSTENGGWISFSPSMRSHGSSDDFITGRTTDDNQHLRLQLAGNGNVSHTDLYFNGNSTYGLDPGYDAGVFGNVAGAFSIYSRLVADDQGIDLAIQSLPQDIYTSDDLVPLGINAGAGTSLTIGIESSNLPQDVDIYLMDVQEQQVAHLNTETFGITPTGDLNGTGRFYLGFSNGLLSTGSHEIDRVRVYAREGHILIEGQLVESTDFKLYDIQGRLVMQGALEPHVMVRHIEAGALNGGVYLVELNNGDVRKAHKVILD